MMISESTKAKAISMLKQHATIEQVASEFDIPNALIKEWANLEGMNLIAAEANAYAVGQVLKGDVLDETKIDKLREKLHDAALLIVDDIRIATGDPMYAKSLQLCAQTVGILYTSLCQSALDASKNNPETDSLFSQLMRD